MINSLQLWPMYRDTWGYFDAAIAPLLAPLDHNQCYRPKYYNAPSIDLQNMVPGAYLRYTLTITPGSLIWGFQCALENPTFSVQITDVGTTHKFWDTPITNVFLSNPNTNHSSGGVGGYPNLLPCPFPVVGNGLFSCEFWANPANTYTERCYLIFCVAEVSECG